MPTSEREATPRVTAFQTVWHTLAASTNTQEGDWRGTLALLEEHGNGE